MLASWRFLDWQLNCWQNLLGSGDQVILCINLGRWSYHGDSPLNQVPDRD